MLSSELIDLIQQQSATAVTSTAETTGIEHCGDVGAELSALEQSSVVCPVGDLIRITATGNDRARFLHNFCTNDVNGMQPGNLCEAFFTDVKAKIIAHGYILAGDASHELWMLPGSQEAILNHLNRYIITEDVMFTADEDASTALAVMGPTALTVLAAATLPVPENVEQGCAQTDEASVMTTSWNRAPFALVSVRSNTSCDVWERLTAAGAVPSGTIIFEHQRIRERFPRIGIDLTDANLAPEADRIPQAVCYTKGCYLGQEPIARLDAMGHVNRKLYVCTAVPSDAAADETLPTVSSVSQVNAQDYPVLIQLKVKSVNESECILARTSDGEVLALTLA